MIWYSVKQTSKCCQNIRRTVSSSQYAQTRPSLTLSQQENNTDINIYLRQKTLTNNENIFSNKLISLFLNEGMLLRELWSHSWLSIKLKVPRRWTKQINSSKCKNKYKLSYFYQPSKLWLKTHLSAHPHRWGIHRKLSIIVLKRDLQRSTEVKV